MAVWDQQYPAGQSGSPGRATLDRDEARQDRRSTIGDLHPVPATLREPAPAA